MGCSCDGDVILNIFKFIYIYIKTEGFLDFYGANSGIMSGHAYSIIDVFTLPYNEKE